MHAPCRRPKNLDWTGQNVLSVNSAHVDAAAAAGATMVMNISTGVPSAHQSASRPRRALSTETGRQPVLAADHRYR